MGLTLPHLADCAGPAGGSVREISRCTGADVKSWTSAKDCTGPGQIPRDTRVFVIEVRHHRCSKSFCRYSEVHGLTAACVDDAVCPLRLICNLTPDLANSNADRATERPLSPPWTSSLLPSSATRTSAKAPTAVRTSVLVWRSQLVLK